jgi:rSAM/selenodomain-associated transferase 2
LSIVSNFEFRISNLDDDQHSMNSRGPFLSVIVPVLNEAALLGEFLRSLRRLANDSEIIMVDGGSTDGSPQIAGSLADRVVTAPRGRASQMNAGAEIARGEVLWFLHADAEVPANWIDPIRKALDDPHVVGGCFRLRYPRPELIYRISDSLGNLGVRVFGFALGDHGIFCRRGAFLSVGGYPDVPILEDAELYRRLKRVGRMQQVAERMVSDARTFEKCGRYQTTIVYFLILALYVAGMPIEWLNRIYRRFHSRSRETRIAARAMASSFEA